MKPNLLLALTGLLAIGMCETSNAESVAIESVEWMTVDCDLIVRGRISEASVPGGVTVSIDEILKGTHEGKTITFRTHLSEEKWQENRHEILFFLNLGQPNMARREQGSSVTLIVPADPNFERSAELVKEPAAGRDEAKVGRYTLRSAEKGTILLDTISGQTWMLMPYQDKQAWLPVPRVNLQRALPHCRIRFQAEPEEFMPHHEGSGFR